MKTSTSHKPVQDEIGCLQQIVAHVGGMARAWLRNRPIHFGFHWGGICRALSLAVRPRPQPIPLAKAATELAQVRSALTTHSIIRFK
jgi:hypothetical protein